MRISDWSSDVCSSDLSLAPLGAHQETPLHRPVVEEPAEAHCLAHHRHGQALALLGRLAGVGGKTLLVHPADRGEAGHHRLQQRAAEFGRLRSEEHTSELQSLMRISYAVFCLKKKNKEQATHTT